LEAVQQAEHRWPAQTKRLIISTPTASERDSSTSIWTVLTAVPITTTQEQCVSNGVLPMVTWWYMKKYRNYIFQ